MLGKLIKHEFKDTAKLFLIMYAAITIVAIADKIFFYINEDWIFANVLSGVLLATYILGIAALFIMTVVVVVKRFYDNMLKDQGYLTFTLPVTTNAHMVSKLLVAFIWSVLTCVVTVITLVITIIDKDVIEVLPELINIIVETIAKYDLYGLIIKIVIYSVVSAIMSILSLYFCLSVGQLFNKHKILGAALTFFGIYIIMQIIMQVVITTITINIDMVDALLYGNVYLYISFADIMLDIYLIIYIILAIVFYVASTLILDKKLNLE